MNQQSVLSTANGACTALGCGNVAVGASLCRKHHGSPGDIAYQDKDVVSSASSFEIRPERGTRYMAKRSRRFTLRHGGRIPATARVQHHPNQALPETQAPPTRFTLEDKTTSMGTSVNLISEIPSTGSDSLRVNERTKLHDAQGIPTSYVNLPSSPIKYNSNPPNPSPLVQLGHSTKSSSNLPIQIDTNNELESRAMQGLVPPADTKILTSEHQDPNKNKSVATQEANDNWPPRYEPHIFHPSESGISITLCPIQQDETLASREVGTGDSHASSAPGPGNSKPDGQNQAGSHVQIMVDAAVDTTLGAERVENLDSQVFQARNAMPIAQQETRHTSPSSQSRLQQEPSSVRASQRKSPESNTGLHRHALDSMLFSDEVLGKNITASSYPHDSGIQRRASPTKKSVEKKPQQHIPSPLRNNYTTPKKDFSMVNRVTKAPHTTLEEHRKANLRNFDSAAFDTMIYRQSNIRPPKGVTISSRSPDSVPHSAKDHRMYLRTDPSIHLLHKRSENWYKKKAQEIQARGGRKFWFGKVMERERWLRAKEKAQEEKHNNDYVPVGGDRKGPDPKPWSYGRALDFGDVPADKLPEDVLQNPAWVKACAWHRETHAKNILLQRATKDGAQQAWDFCLNIMNTAGSKTQNKQA